MRWFQVTAAALMAVALAGCPSEFGRDGRIGKAAHKDMQERAKPVECSEEYLKEVCEGPNQDDALCELCLE